MTHPSESDTGLILASDMVSSAWHCLGTVASPALHSVMACPDLLFIQPAQHECIAGNVAKPGSTMWLIP